MKNKKGYGDMFIIFLILLWMVSAILAINNILTSPPETEDQRNDRLDLYDFHEYCKDKGFDKAIYSESIARRNYTCETEYNSSLEILFREDDCTNTYKDIIKCERKEFINGSVNTIYTFFERNETISYHKEGFNESDFNLFKIFLMVFAVVFILIFGFKMSKGRGI